MVKCIKVGCNNSACYGGGHFGVCAIHWWSGENVDPRELIGEIVRLNEENIRLKTQLAEYKKPPEVKSPVMVGQKLSGGGKLDTRPTVKVEPTDEQRKHIIDQLQGLMDDRKKAIETYYAQNNYSTPKQNKPYYLCHLCGEWEDLLTQGSLFGDYYYCCSCIPKKDGIRQKLKALYLHAKWLWMIETGKR